MKPFDFYSGDDCLLYDRLDKLSLAPELDFGALPLAPFARDYEVSVPDEEYSFLHEAAVVEYHGRLFASWYNNSRFELTGRTPIRGRHSDDGGKTWSPVKVLADDPSGEVLYCPPVYGVCDDTLYLFMNRMTGPDLIQALDLYRYDEKTDAFVFLHSEPSLFKLNTNVCVLPDGKLLLPGRIGERGVIPGIPAVMISDSGNIDAPWRVVKVQPDDRLPDGTRFIHPETSAIVNGRTVLLFCRDDERRVPLVYRSDDCGEHWSAPLAVDIPFSASKIYAGTLSDGRNYVVGNLYPGRNRLALLLTEPGQLVFTKGYILQDGLNAALGYGVCWHYPCVCEGGGNLNVICTVSHEDFARRGAVLTVLPLDRL